MKCPRDENYLNSFGNLEDTIIQCNCCKGLVIHSLKVPSLKDFKASTTETKTRISELACPNCYQHMQAILYLGIEIDICNTCNLIWLDNGEHEKIVSLHNKNNSVKFKVTSVENPTSEKIIGQAGAISEFLNALILIL